METQSVNHSVKKTRAQVLRDKVVIRLATNEVGPQIAGILKDNGIELAGADWSKVFPHWIIATVEDDVIGCLQVLPALPVAHMEFLYVKESVGFKLRAIAIRKLALQGMASAIHMGASYIAGNVDFRNFKFRNVIEKFNVQHVGDRTLFAKKLRD